MLRATYSEGVGWVATVHRQTGEAERIAVRRGRVLELRVGGGSVRAIAESMGIPKSTVHRDLRAALADLRSEQFAHADDYRSLLLERHEHNYLKLHPQLAAGHLGAHAHAVRILQEEAKLLGLYAPELHAAVTRDGDDLPPLEELMQRYADARRRDLDADGG